MRSVENNEEEKNLIEDIKKLDNVINYVFISNN